MKTLDRLFGCLLVLGGIGHGFGSYNAYRNEPMALLWALSGSLAVFLVAAINLLRAGRRGDRALAWIAFAACLGWCGFALWFGVLIGNVFDFRPLINLVVTAVLALFSLRSAFEAHGRREA